MRKRRRERRGRERRKYTVKLFLRASANISHALSTSNVSSYRVFDMSSDITTPGWGICFSSDYLFGLNLSERLPSPFFYDSEEEKRRIAAHTKLPKPKRRRMWRSDTHHTHCGSPAHTLHTPQHISITHTQTYIHKHTQTRSCTPVSQRARILICAHIHTQHTHAHTRAHVLTDTAVWIDKSCMHAHTHNTCIQYANTITHPFRTSITRSWGSS